MTELREELEPPPRRFDVVAMPAVGIVEIEDGEEGSFGSVPLPGVGDVDEVVGVGCDELDAVCSKGSITFLA